MFMLIIKLYFYLGERQILQVFPLYVFNDSFKNLPFHFFIIVLKVKVLVKKIREVKERNPKWKGSKTADDMILYIENPKDASREQLELIQQIR